MRAKAPRPAVILFVSSMPRPSTPREIQTDYVAAAENTCRSERILRRDELSQSGTPLNRRQPMKKLIPAVPLLAAAALFGCDRPGTSTSSTTVVKEPPQSTASTTVVQPAPTPPQTSVTVDASKPATETTRQSTTTKVETPEGTATKRDTTTTTTTK